MDPTSCAWSLPSSTLGSGNSEPEHMASSPPPPITKKFDKQKCRWKILWSSPGLLDRTFDEIECAVDADVSEGAGHGRPALAEVGLSVLGEERGKRGLLEEGAALVVLRLEWIHLPMVDGFIIPS